MTIKDPGVSNSIGRPELEVFKHLVPLIRNIARDRLGIHSKAEGRVILAELSQDRAAAQNVLAHWTALILVSGGDLKLTLKVHYYLDEAKVFGAQAGSLPENSDSASSDRLTHDFIKEYCNLTAGRLKRLFEDQKFVTGISLPLITRGFDEVFSPGPNGTTSFEDAWEFRLDGHSIACTSKVEVIESKTLLELCKTGAFTLINAAESVDEGEVEFL